ncbi:MAG: B12-binding domain-containing radical SAM protein [Actinobacteria bacterium]|nr:B12-binding domain-containing radical SAM protein [Actinomycetota bacterium]
MQTETTSDVTKILFIVLPYLLQRKDAKNSKIRSFEAFPYGLLSVASYVQQKTARPVSIKIIDCNLHGKDDYLDAISNCLGEFRPDIVGLSMMFDNSYKYLESISRLIKAFDESLLLVLGGAAASFSWDTILAEQSDIDAVCYAEGELPFLRLVDADNRHLLLNDDPSWVTRESMLRGKKPQASFIANLNEVINIDYSLVENYTYRMKEAFSPFLHENDGEKRQYFLVSSRGCPYRCVFCSNASIHGKQIRYADVKQVIKHVADLINDYGMNVLTIYDDQLLSNVDRAKQLFRELASFKLRVECPNGLSVAFIDEELAMLMKLAGVDTVALAIESGSDYLIRNVIHKPLRLEMVKPAVQLLRKQGLFVEGFFVNGLPGESDSHRRETLEFIKEVELDWSGFSLAAPFRGSPLYDICVKNGYIDRDVKLGDIVLDKYIITTPDSDPEHVTLETYRMNLDVNFVNNYRLKSGDYEVAANCFRDVIRRYEGHAFAYYFLSKAQEHLPAEQLSANESMKNFFNIVNNDADWLAHAKYFNLL